MIGLWPHHKITTEHRIRYRDEISIVHIFSSNVILLDCTKISDIMSLFDDGCTTVITEVESTRRNLIILCRRIETLERQVLSLGHDQ
ncbi:hypothetical protein CEXT_653441 [Caerostris extrusa]|uniref:Uncharacterized protein n=1 Tax=Caerostris extrusa TaxID=172846 RepID=A0AAV4WCE3_CAEEX|nr:hypothetical protein CEXT_653441 [Caerostris extrusa]